LILAGILNIDVKFLWYLLNTSWNSLRILQVPVIRSVAGSNVSLTPEAGIANIQTNSKIFPCNLEWHLLLFVHYKKDNVLWSWSLVTAV